MAEAPRFDGYDTSLAPPSPLVKAALAPGAPPAGPVLAAVSGGADSVALLRLLAWLAPSRGWRVVVGHVDHGLRPDSAADAAFVAALAKELGLGSLERRVTVAARGQSPEEAARLARREALLAMAREAGATCVALAHSAEDQAETLLYRVVAGTGPDGLAGMRARSGAWWRPLLPCARADLRGWLVSLGQNWREDPSNADPRYARNRVRHDLLPQALAINPQAPGALGRLAEICDQEADYWERWGRDWLARWGQAQGNSWRLSQDGLADLHPAQTRRLLRLVAGMLVGSGQHLDHAQLNRAREALGQTPGYGLDLGAGLRVWREHGAMRLGLAAPPAKFLGGLDGPGALWLPALGRWLLAGEAAAPATLAVEPGVCWLPVDAVVWPLWVASPRPGQRFHPLGGPAPKKIARFMLDQKIPPWWRARTVVVGDQRGVWWLAPWRPDQRVKESGQQPRMLCLRFVDTPANPKYT